MAARWSKWPDLVGSDGGARDYGSQRRCESNLVSYGGLVVVEGRRIGKTRKSTCVLFFLILDVCRNLPFGGRVTRDSRDACSTKGIRAESPPTFI